MKILLVEDHPGSRKNLQRLMQRRGHEVVAVGSAFTVTVVPLEVDEQPFAFVIRTV